MSRDRSLCAGLWRQQGAGLPMAIFLITVMALIVTTMAQLQQSSGEMEALDILSTRAFYAAESGAEVLLVQAMEKTPAECASGEVTFEASGLKGCSADVTCEASGNTIRIISEGQCGTGRTAASRTVEVKVQ